jgi:hypothetical protein
MNLALGCIQPIGPPRVGHLWPARPQPAHDLGPFLPGEAARYTRYRPCRPWRRPDRACGPGGEALSRGCHNGEEATATRFGGGGGAGAHPSGWQRRSSTDSGSSGGGGATARRWAHELILRSINSSLSKVSHYRWGRRPSR